MTSGSTKRRRRREKRALQANIDGGAVDGSSDGFRQAVANADQAALRTRLRQLLREKFEYEDFWLADGSVVFETWYKSICDGESGLCEELRPWLNL